MANGRSDGSVIIDTQIDTSGIVKGMHDVKGKITAAANSVGKLGDSSKQVFIESNSAMAGKSYEQLQAEIRKTEVALDKLIERQIKFVETGGNVKSRAFASMEYDIEETRNRLFGLQAQLERVSKETPRTFSRMEHWTERVKNAFNELNKSTKKSRYSITRMLGTSILFSTVFRAISTVTKGFTEGIGNLAQYSAEANETMSALKSSLTQLKNSFATAFMPLITLITPAMTKLINMMIEVTNYASAFFSALAGKTSYEKAVVVQENFAESLNKTAKSAKNALKYLSGLDEIKLYSEKETTDVLPENMFQTEKIEGPIRDIAQIVKEAFNEGNFEILGRTIGRFINSIDWVGILSKTGQLIWQAINAGLEMYAYIFDEAPIETTIITAIAALKFTGLGAVLWTAIVNEMKYGLYVAGQKISLLFAQLFPFISKGFSALLSMLSPGIIGEFGIWISNVLKDTFLDTSTWDGPLKAIENFLVMVGEKIIDGVANFLVNSFRALMDSALVKGLSGIIGSIERSLRGLIDFIAGAFTGNWQRAWEGIADFFIGIINIIPKAVEGIINVVIEIINGLIWGVNKLTGVVNIPAIPEIPKVEIPMLATGAVIPPNAPFMAVLGDQKSGTNIEAPLDTIKQAVREVIGNGTGGGQYQFTAQINRRTLFDEFIDEARLRQNVSGRNPFDLGKGVMI